MGLLRTEPERNWIRTLTRASTATFSFGKVYKVKTDKEHNYEHIDDSMKK
jgi:hypothetical protein